MGNSYLRNTLRCPCVIQISPRFDFHLPHSKSVLWLHGKNLSLPVLKNFFLFFLILISSVFLGQGNTFAVVLVPVLERVDIFLSHKHTLVSLLTPREDL